MNKRFRRVNRMEDLKTRIIIIVKHTLFSRMKKKRKIVKNYIPARIFKIYSRHNIGNPVA